MGILRQVSVRPLSRRASRTLKDSSISAYSSTKLPSFATDSCWSDLQYQEKRNATKF